MTPSNIDFNEIVRQVFSSPDFATKAGEAFERAVLDAMSEKGLRTAIEIIWQQVLNNAPASITLSELLTLWETEYGPAAASNTQIITAGGITRIMFFSEVAPKNIHRDWLCRIQPPGETIKQRAEIDRPLNPRKQLHQIIFGISADLTTVVVDMAQSDICQRYGNHAAPHQAAEQASIADSAEDGLYAVHFRDNWDDRGNTYFLLARKKNNEWRSEESNRLLLEHEGDKILELWLLDADKQQGASNE